MNRKIRALIVDDELLARRALRAMLKDDPEIEVIADCRNGKEAIAAIRGQSPDLVFLDVQMPEINGFEVIEEVGIKQMPVTIFVTAYDKHALRAFEVRALDYLLKPFDHDRFNVTLQRAKNFIRQQKLGEMSESLFAVLNELKSKSDKPLSERDEEAHKNPIDRVVVKSSGRIYLLKVEDIDWVEGTSNYLSLHSGSKIHLIREKMSVFHAKLDAKKFLRIHRSTIVNIEKIQDMQPLFKGEYVVTLTSGKRLRASRGYRHELQALINEAR